MLLDSSLAGFEASAEATLTANKGTASQPGSSSNGPSMGNTSGVMSFKPLERLKGACPKRFVSQAYFPNTLCYHEPVADPPAVCGSAGEEDG